MDKRLSDTIEGITLPTNCISPTPEQVERLKALALEGLSPAEMSDAFCKMMREDKDREDE